jgi:superoxide dismutase, Fe-Mn family
MALRGKNNIGTEMEEAMNGFGSGKISTRSKGASLFVVICLVFAVTFTHCGVSDKASKIVQEPLPYAQNALEPYISTATMGYHYGKHHAAYVASANTLISGSPFAGKTSAEIIVLTSGKAENAAIFNNVAQHFNHAFFWKCLKPLGGGTPTGKLAEKIDASFGNFTAFKKAFLEAAKGHFGSGWVWLVQEGDLLKIETTGNADTPIARGTKPVFCVDVWEHAYYLDYQNRRSDFVETVLDKLANWDFVASQLEETAKAS